MSRAQFADLLRLASIQRLSVFLSLLESVYLPGDANYAFCLKASGLISREMDGVLEYLLLVFANDTQQSGAALASNPTTGVQDSTSVNYAAGAWHADTALNEITEWDTAALMDMDGWMEGVDWTNVSGGV